MPYAQLTITAPAIMIGQDERSTGPEESGDAATKLTKQRHAIISAQVFGVAAATYLEAVREAISTPALIRAAGDQNFAVLDVSNSFAVPQMLDTGFEERVQADITLGWIDVVTTTADGTIESADVDGTVDGITVDVEAP
jgi:hypothetical protein